MLICWCIIWCFVWKNTMLVVWLKRQRTFVSCTYCNEYQCYSVQCCGVNKTLALWQTGLLWPHHTPPDHPAILKKLFQKNNSSRDKQNTKCNFDDLQYTSIISVQHLFKVTFFSIIICFSTTWFWIWNFLYNMTPKHQLYMYSEDVKDFFHVRALFKCICV